MDFKLVAPATNSYFCLVKNEIPDFVKDAIVPRIGKTAKFIKMMIQSHFDDRGIPLTKEQFVVLLCLEREAKPQSFLAMITERDKGSLTRLVQSLEQKKYIIRKVCKEDSRVNLVEITSKGVEVLNKTKPLILELFSLLQTGIEPENMEVALKVIEQVQKNAIQELKLLEEKKL